MHEIGGFLRDEVEDEAWVAMFTEVGGPGGKTCALCGVSFLYCEHGEQIVDRHRKRLDVERREREVEERARELDEIVADGETLAGLRELRERYGDVETAFERLDDGWRALEAAWSVVQESANRGDRRRLSRLIDGMRRAER